MTQETDIIGLVRELQEWHEKNSWYADEGMVDKLCRNFPAIATHLLKQEEALQKVEQVYEYGFNDGYKIRILDQNAQWKTENERDLLIAEMTKDALSPIRSISSASDNE